MFTQFVRRVPWSSGESTMGPETELQNMSTTHSHGRTRLPTHTHRPNHPPTHQPTHPRRATAILQYVQQDMRSYMPSLSLCRAGISIFLRFSATPGSERPVPGRASFQGPARRAGHRRPFFRRGHRGLMCGASVARLWCRGGSGGARESPLFFGYGITIFFFSKIHLDTIITINTTTAEQHYLIRILRSSCRTDIHIVGT